MVRLVVEEVGGDNRVPRDYAALWHFVEHPACDLYLTEARVVVDAAVGGDDLRRA